ncbi:MAG: hydrolase TatD [Bacteroides sp.]|nr:hydrolase TatD [Bacteroides sp.]
MTVLDIHTHHPAPQPLGVISAAPEELPVLPGAQLYSAGIHPWNVKGIGLSAAQTAALTAAASRSDVVAIGETGIDLVREGCAPLAGQINAMRAHIDLSESLGKPLILHCVRGHDIIAQTRRELNPTQPWIIHGFRGKPSIADILLKAGCVLSFGDRFNAEALLCVPPEAILAETDEAEYDIREVIGLLAECRPEIDEALISANSARVLGL